MPYGVKVWQPASSPRVFLSAGRRSPDKTALALEHRFAGRAALSLGRQGEDHFALDAVKWPSKR